MSWSCLAYVFSNLTVDTENLNLSALPKLLPRMRNSAGTIPAEEAGRQKNEILSMSILLLGPDCSEKGYGEREGRMDVTIHITSMNYLLAGKDQGRSTRTI